MQAHPSKPRSFPGKASTRLHACADYAIAIALLLSTFTPVYPDSVMKNLALAMGGMLFLLSLVTDYPFSILRFVPLPIHRGADLLLGILLAFSPVHFAAHGLPLILWIAAGVVLIYLSFWTVAQRGPKVSG